MTLPPTNNLPVCAECGSCFFPDVSGYASLCSECAHWIYGIAACDHEFQNQHCSKCGWDGSTSAYILQLKATDSRTKQAPEGQ